MIETNDKVHENDRYIKELQRAIKMQQEHSKMQQNAITNLTMQNDNLMTVITLLEQKNGGK
jgi:hypothetical protein